MGAFRDRLKAMQPANVGGRRWLYVPYDQLTDAVGPLAGADPASVGIVLVESADKANRRPYHRQKLLWVLASMRHFALEQAARGVAVDYRHTEGPYASALAAAVADHGPLTVMRPAERELRHELQPLVDDGRLQVVPHEGWLTHAADFEAIGGPPWRMDRFYRQVRRRTGVLMQGASPEGGRFSFDGDNRKAWPGTPAAPAPPRFEPDDVTTEVVRLIERTFADHPGQLQPERVPATQRQAEEAWNWAVEHCLPLFGPFEDAMSTQSRTLFHTVVSPLLHNHRILPSRVVQEVAALDVPLPSREGFVRQVLGWREFMRHVHEHTDGFRDLPNGYPRDVLGSGQPLFPTFWGGSPSGLRCLDEVVQGVWEDGYSHHITRLMVLSNLATLFDMSARELTDWFWVAYIDAYDWVVEPNVLAMGTFSVGDLMTTKPYVSGSAYVNKMSDYCDGCAFHPKRTCPITSLYWAFLERHHGVLSNVERAKLQMSSLRRRSAEKKAHDAEVFRWVSDTLGRGGCLTPRR